MLASVLSVVTAMLIGASPGATLKGGMRFADEVIQYDPAFGGSVKPRNHDARRALGPVRHNRDVSLGRGGLLEVAFIENILTNSGDAHPDLHIFEVGPDVESTFVAVQPADAATAEAIGRLCIDERKPFGDGFCEIGSTRGGTTSLDVDVFFPGFPAGTLKFNAVQLIDDPDQGDDGQPATEGADIDAIGAIAHAPAAKGSDAWGNWLVPSAQVAPVLPRIPVEMPSATSVRVPGVPSVPTSPALPGAPRQNLNAVPR